MGRSSREYCAVFFILTFLFTLTTAEDNNEDYQPVNLPIPPKMRLYIRKKAGMWFGPRMGRKKRNSPYDENYRTPQLEQEQLDALMEAVQEPPWAVVTINEGKRHTVNFTPRLGRESGEENEVESWLRDPELSRELMTQRSPPFAPRLGRRRNAYYFNPRLGRRNDLKQL